MKKIIYAILGIFMMVACTDDHLEDIPTLPKENANGKKVTLNFSVAVPEAQNVDSRGFGEKATISKMYVVVFDGSGRLSESVEATLVNATDGKHTDVDHTVQKDYTVTLTATDQSRIIHFVAYDEITNDPLTEKLDPTTIQYASESSIFGEDLNVTGERDVYWQRITVSGIYAQKNDDNSNKTDNQGNVIGQIPDEMKLVHLVRNFAKITVNTDKVKSPTSFKYTGFVVVNTESHGTVAPYNGTRGFPNYVASTTTGETTTYSCVSYDNLVSTQRFTGTVPSRSSTNEEIPETPETVTENNPDPYTSAAKYVYERTHNDNTPTYIIIKGTWNGDETYYKVDIVKKGSANANGTGYTPDQYYHILRNFAYNIVIEGVNGEGYDTAEQAAAEAASNNISASVTLQPLANISDGTSRLFVNYTEKILISGKQNSVDLEFMYLQNANSTGHNNDQVFIINGDGGIINGDISQKTTGTNTNYWTYTIPVTTVDVLSEQTVTVFVPGGLQRTVKYIMIPQAYSLVADCWDGGNETVDREDKLIPANMNKKVTVSVKIPTGLPSSIFPLTFILGSNQHSIYSDAAKNSLPVRSGANVIPGNSTSNISFAFEKELTKEVYDKLVTDAGSDATTVEFLCYFKTNKAQSASNIYVYNEYFNLGETAFTNSEAEVEVPTVITVKNLSGNEISGLQFNRNTNSQSISISINKSDVTITEVKSQNGRYNCTKNNNGTYTISAGYNAWQGEDALIITASDETTKRISLSYNW